MEPTEITKRCISFLLMLYQAFTVASLSSYFLLPLSSEMYAQLDSGHVVDLARTEDSNYYYFFTIVGCFKGILWVTVHLQCEVLCNTF